MNLESVKVRDEYEQQGLIRTDTLNDLKIYTYTTKCEYAHAWDDVTLNSRGHIFNVKTGECIACPFSKFFNVGQRQVQPNLWNPCQVVEKLDGWLGILYRHAGNFRIATRGSFQSVGAVIGSAWLNMEFKDGVNRQKLLKQLPEEVTLIFEIISPETKIIVDYNNATNLVLTAAFNRHTGEEYSWEQVCAWAEEFSLDLPKIYEGWSSFHAIELAKTLEPNIQEGFVLRFENGQRLKVKGKQYIELASVLKQLTPLSLWKTMQNGKVNDAFLTIFQEPWLSEARQITKNLESGYRRAKALVEADYKTVRCNIENTHDRKEFANAVKRYSKYPPAMFSLYDGRNIDRFIMKHIKPRPSGRSVLTENL